MVKLSNIQYTVQKISEAIASILNMDVIICDDKYNKIGDTKKHFDVDSMHIDSHSILGRVINTGKIIVIDEKEKDKNCQICEEKNKCKLLSMIGIPIKYGNTTIGGIGLIAISEEYQSILIDRQKYLIEFLERMVELIISKLLQKVAANNLHVMRKQLISIMNSIDEGIIAIDENGYITYTNSVIDESFGISSSELNEKKICDIISHDYIKYLVKDNIQFSNKEITITRNKNEFQTLVSSKAVEIGDESIGSILTFKKMSDVYKVVNEISLNNFSTTFDDIIGKSFEIQQTKMKARKVSNSNSTILIQGESGTGKELFARAIHYYSNRNNKPFIAINCAAIPETLLESELFGYEEGAFTGAMKGGKAGKFQLAHEGTMFLDEIGDMPLHLQTKLLRVLQEKTIEKIGGHKNIPIDVRVIAATNKDLDTMVENGEFREDLFYRLNVIPLFIPPLRERKGDIKVLLDHFLKLSNKKLDKNIESFSSNVENILLNYCWKGNVRELENIVEYAVNMETTSTITINSIPVKIRNVNGKKLRTNIMSIQEMEKKLIQEALLLYGDSVKGKNMAADALGISRATLYRKIKEYNL